MIACALLAMLCGSRAPAQNLVTNGDFELYNTCPPSSFYNIPYSPNYTFFPTVQAWVSPNLATPDYFNRCATNSISSVPRNFAGYQQPHSGNAYLGIYSYADPDNYREAVTTRLSAPMKRDSAYCVRFFISTAVVDNITSINAMLNEVGACFTDTLPYSPTIKLNPNLSYHVGNDTFRHLSDTSKWYEIQGVYVARGGEQWMTIGIFSPVLNCSVLFPSADGSVMGYMYLDDVSVMPGGAHHDSTYTLMLCNSSATLTAGSATGPYRWNTGDTTRTIHISRAGNYTCNVLIGCEVFRDFFYVAETPHYDSLHNVFICETGTTTADLQSSMPSGPYRWSTGDITRTIRIGNIGYYICSVEKDCMIYRDIFHVRISTTPPSPVYDTAICQHTVAPKLDVRDTGLIWYQNVASDIGSTIQPEINTTQFGQITTLYVARKVGDCISSRVPITASIILVPTSHALDTAVHCEGIFDHTLHIGRQAEPYVRYEWSTGEYGCCIMPTADGRYIRTATNPCATVEDTIYVRSSPCERCIVFPDAFTPNHDGHNDKFKALIICPLNNFYMRIYNRWGESVYVSNNKEGHWDGTHHGVPAPADTYMYMASFTHAVTNKEGLVKGSVILIR